MRLHKDTKIDLLKAVPIFAGCSKSELQQIAQLADELDLAEGATLIREGERGREFIVVAEGTVRVTRGGKTLRDLGSGDFIGEIALVADVPRTATVTATSPVRLLVVTDRAQGPPEPRRTPARRRAVACPRSRNPPNGFLPLDPAYGGANP